SPSAISVGAAGKIGCGTFSIEPARKKRGCAVVSLTTPPGLCAAAAADGWGRSGDCGWGSIEGITLPSTEPKECPNASVQVGGDFGWLGMVARPGAPGSPDCCVAGRLALTAATISLNSSSVVTTVSVALLALG